MHDLLPITALGGAEPCVDAFDHVTISENDALALASVTARMGHETACHAKLKNLIRAVPGADKAQFGEPMSGFWTGPDQWMLSAARDEHEQMAETLADLFAETASITEQTGAWVCFDVTGPAMADLCERLCAVPIRKMRPGDTHRTMIHHMSCFVIRYQDAEHIRILGPRASAGSLHHALLTTAQSVA
ncbi:sarcosine oxidase subunit gamma [Aliiroseovarius sp. YM-037]|uniref:sarcosine oxidase subunit gamma n=1 Tax=Aliiroseovarius sp. YM-037 TaxID=3341728 RepID=UPI003A7FD370